MCAPSAVGTNLSGTIVGTITTNSTELSQTRIDALTIGYIRGPKPCAKANRVIAGMAVPVHFAGAASHM